jgi:UDP-glucose:(heptosyl)LPS alpha-1,3-glucosyltransferase
MRIAFCFYKYFPFGGLQRDFLRIALACQARGHSIRVYTLEWRGDVPAGFEVVLVPVSALSNPRRYAKFSRWVGEDLAARPANRVVGFNKMPGLDVYFAADPCFEDKARTLRSALYRMSGRYRHFSAYERAVFGPEADTEILLISPLQKPLFQKYYATPDERFHLLPPGIARDRRAPENAPEIRAAFRHEFALAANDLLLLQLGSGFKTKGLDRSLKALRRCRQRSPVGVGCLPSATMRRNFFMRRRERSASLIGFASCADAATSRASCSAPTC